MKIETATWSWPEAVEKKEVYRDEEFVRTQTKEQALEAIEFLMEQPSERTPTYTITVFRDGEYFTYWRHSMPCLGGLVKYAVTHGDRYYMNPYFPRDIKVMFPEGEIVFIASMLKNTLNTPLHEFLLSQESPWVSAFGSKESMIIQPKKYFVLTNMDTDPTVFFSLMRYSLITTSIDRCNIFKNWDPRAHLLARLYAHADPRRLAGQKPIRISGGTWAQGYGYTRPYNDAIFKTEIPMELKDFGKYYHGDSPYPIYDTTYFINEMAEQFGLNVRYGRLETTDGEKALIQAWDYFKAKAVELTDTPGKVKDERQDSVRANRRKNVPVGAVLS